MLERLGRFLLRRRWAVLAATLAVVLTGLVAAEDVDGLVHGCSFRA